MQRLVIPRKASFVPPNAKRVFKGVIYDVYNWDQKMFDGTIQTFEMLKRPDTVKIIAIKNNSIVVVEQKQPHTDYFYDIPGGMHDVESENELQAAKRELKEETGIVCANWKLLNVVQSHTKIEQFSYTFLAWNVTEDVKQELDSGEIIKVHLMTLEEVNALIGNPKTRFMPKKILNNVNSIDELLALSAYTP